MAREVSKQHLEDWHHKQALAENMIPLIGSLYRGHSVVLRVFGYKIMNASTTAIVKAHRDGRLIVGEELDMQKSYQMLQLIADMKLRPCRLDLGKLCHEFLQQDSIPEMQEFIDQRLAQLLGDSSAQDKESHDVVLYGFGRIGRILARLLIDRTGTGAKLRLRGVVVRAKGDIEKDLLKRAELLRRDSIHGEFDGAIQVNEKSRAIIANGNYIQFIYANSPSEIDYTEYGIEDALVVDNTGVWKNEEGLGQHIACNGISKVLLTAPAQGDIKNIVYGINDDLIAATDTILCAATWP